MEFSSLKMRDDDANEWDINVKWVGCTVELSRCASPQEMLGAMTEADRVNDARYLDNTIFPMAYEEYRVREMRREELRPTGRYACRQFYKQGGVGRTAVDVQIRKESAHWRSGDNMRLVERRYSRKLLSGDY
jgi:hypothetical protein